jgi:uncharacterized membrane protein
MPRLKTLSLVFLIAFLAVAGLAHFVRPAVYPPLMPPYLPRPEWLHLLAGALELVAAGLFGLPRTRRWAAYLTLGLLASFFTVHIYHLQLGYFPGPLPAPLWLLWARLPIQGVFMAWAWWHRK